MFPLFILITDAVANRRSAFIIPYLYYKIHREIIVQVCCNQFANGLF